MEKMQFRKIVPGALVFLVMMISVSCLPTNTFAHGLLGVSKTLGVVVNTNLAAELVIAALIFFNYLVFLAHKQLKREQRY